MRQAVHIFLKDSRQLRVPIAISLAWTALFAATGVFPWFRGPEVDTWDQVSYLVQRFSPYILPGAWLLLVSLVFHTEPLPGDRHFWLTRPYSRASLAGARTLFVLAYVTLPMTVAQAVLVVLNGLPLSPSLPGLVWEQVLISALVVVPGAALAALTSRLTHFILSLSLVPAVLVANEFAGQWSRLEWVRTSAALTVVVLFAMSVLLVQFTRRRTGQSRTIGLAGVLAVIIVPAAMPWRVAFAVHERLAASGDLVIRAALVPLPKPPGLLALVPNAQIDRRLQFHFDVTGPSADAPIKCEGAAIAIEGPSGEVWTSSLQRYPQWPDMSSIEKGCLLQLRVPDSLRASPQPVHVRAALYVTVFGAERSTRVAADAVPVLVPDAGVCRSKTGISSERFNPRPVTRIECRTAFLPSAALFRVDREGSSSNGLDSYSPFPAFLTMGPVFLSGREFMGDDSMTPVRASRPAGAWPAPPDAVTVYSRPAVAHVRLDVDARGVNLADYDLTR